MGLRNTRRAPGSACFPSPSRVSSTLTAIETSKQPCATPRISNPCARDSDWWADCDLPDAPPVCPPLNFYHTGSSEGTTNLHEFEFEGNSNSAGSMGLPSKPRRCNSLCTRVRDTTKRRKMGSQICFPSTFACDNTRTLSVNSSIPRFRRLLRLLSCLAPTGGAPVGARVCVRQDPGQLGR